MNPGMFNGFGQQDQTVQADVPLGGLVGLVDTASPNPIINGAEYLKSSVLKSASGYSSLLSSAPYLGCVLGTVGQPHGVANPVGVAGTSNGNVYVIPGDGVESTRVAPSVSGSFSAVSDTSHSVPDFCVMGPRLVLLRGTNQVTSVSGSTGTLMTITSNQTLCAANTAGTLCVLGSSNIDNTSGGTVTSTNGSTFTSRTPTAGMSDCRIILWNQSSGTFLFITGSGQLWSSPDGFTMTARTALGVNVACLPERPANCWASSPTSAAFLADVSTAGAPSFRALCRTTNGTSFTVTPVSTLLGLDGFQTNPTSLAFVGSEWIMWGSHTQVGGIGSVYRSTDDGVTWTKSPIWVDVNNPSRSAFLLGQGTGPSTTFITSLGDGSAGRLISLASPTATTHVGMPVPALANFDSVGTRHTPLYVRIR